jgi:hypothetical protein
MDDHEWYKVFETKKLYEALMIQSHLKEHNIESVIYNQQDSVYITIGGISVMVKVEDGFEALKIIEEEIS